ncbi:unnamed protein product [Microthlaspi erraticum]|uniref:Uncharacterized protein n=1 Tax=Microthlaspi erraticum TaxID=1685480 RepID=A0A6D2L0L2_9BRAS|nr:unnamed protein product [Microthlaspi erraticum]CAA7041254.1 unnamed protein product [Microthlaspi erraticum]CAA7058969.1 unnamed protein product [Microthlaspi erraticum]CAA7058972.1 unnamed protein product [Microthlaspi erraticum]CAA7060067.1 unnamed protein product [Microthlaspi erraticum]
MPPVLDSSSLHRSRSLVRIVSSPSSHLHRSSTSFSVTMYRVASNLASKARIASNTREVSSTMSWSRNYAAKEIKFGVEAGGLMLRGSVGGGDKYLFLGKRGGQVEGEDLSSNVRTVISELGLAKELLERVAEEESESGIWQNMRNADKGLYLSSNERVVTSELGVAKESLHRVAED